MRDPFKYMLVLCLNLLLAAGCEAQSPVEGLTNLNKLQIVNYCGDFATISFPGEMTDVLFGYRRLGSVDFKTFDMIKVDYVVTDMDGHVINQDSVKNVDPGNGRLWVRFDPGLPPQQRGWFRVQLYVVASKGSQRHWLGEGHVDLAVLPPLLPRVEKPYVGVSMPNGGGAGAYLNAANVVALKRLGVQQLRTFLVWNEVQPDENQPPDWRLMDRIVNTATAAGIRVLPAMRGTPDWAVDANALAHRGKGKHGKVASLRSLKPDLGKFAAFCRMLGMRYKGRVHAWSIWNEPNAITSLHSRSPEDYAQMLETAYKAFRSVDGDVTIATAGLSGVKAGYLKQVVDAGGGPYMQVACVHPYRYAQAIPEIATEGLGIGYGRDTLLNDLASVNKVIAAMGPMADGQTRRQLWVTEGGYNTLPGFPPPLHQAVTIKQQAQYLVRTMALANVGGVQRYYWWRLYDTLGASMGLITNQATSHQPKPAYVALAVFERMAADMKTNDYQQHGDVHVIHFTARNKPMTLAWSIHPEHVAKLTSDKPVTMTTMMGMTSTVDDDAIMLSPSPVYLSGHVTIKP